MKPNQIVMPTIHYCKRNGSPYGCLMRVAEEKKIVEVFDEDTGEDLKVDEFLCHVLGQEYPEDPSGFWLTDFDIYPSQHRWRALMKDLVSTLPLSWFEGVMEQYARSRDAIEAEALKALVGAHYFEDSSDYRGGIWDGVNALDAELAELLTSKPREAWLRVNPDYDEDD